MWLFPLIVVVVIVLIFAIWWISTSNGFKRKQIKVSEALSGIEVALTNRFDKLSKLIDVAKSYAKHEKDTFTQVIQLRKGMTAGELSQANTQCDQLSARLFAVAEGYPELRSAEMFRELQEGIRDAEAHLQASRRLYNSNVTIFNTAIVVFPSSVVARAQNLQKADFFVAEEGKKADVNCNI